MSDRMEKVDELVNHEISILLLKLFPDKIITVTNVEVSKDLGFAKVWISALDDPGKTLIDCQREAATITKVLSKKLELRKHPKIRFYLDNSPSYASKIENLIEEIHKEKK